jgi:hypothetical protein
MGENGQKREVEVLLYYLLEIYKWIPDARLYSSCHFILLSLA